MEPSTFESVSGVIGDVSRPSVTMKICFLFHFQPFPPSSDCYFKCNVFVPMQSHM